MRPPWAPVLLAMLLPVAAAGGKKEETPPSLPVEHLHPSGAFTFRTPADWQLAASPNDPNAIETGGGGLLVRLIAHHGEKLTDALHVAGNHWQLARHGFKHHVGHAFPAGRKHQKLTGGKDFRHVGTPPREMDPAGNPQLGRPSLQQGPVRSLAHQD